MAARDEGRESRSESVESLLQQGLFFYGHGRTDEAVACWRAVLEEMPGHAEALDYLQSAGVLPRRVDSRPATPLQFDDAFEDYEGRVDHALVLKLVREQRFEEALAWLYDAHDKEPLDRNISRIIRLVKERLIIHQRRRIGNMDKVPRLLPTLDEIKRMGLVNDELYVARRIDGWCSVDDLVSVSQLAVNRTLECLLRLVDRGVVTLESSHSTPTFARGSGEATPPPRRPMTEPMGFAPERAHPVRVPPLQPLRGGLADKRDEPDSWPAPRASQPVAKHENRDPFAFFNSPEPENVSDEVPLVVRDRPLVLYADIDPSWLALGKMMLGAFDYDFLECNSGPQVVERCTEQLPDLVIMEFMLPGMDGVRVVQELRKHGRTRGIPVVLVASRVQLDFAKRKIEDERLSFLVKPFDKSELRNQVQQLLGNK